MGGGRVAELKGIVTRCRLEPHGPAPKQLEPERLYSCRKGGEVPIAPSLPPMPPILCPWKSNPQGLLPFDPIQGRERARKRLRVAARTCTAVTL